MIKDGWFDWAIRDPGPEDRWAHQRYRRTPMTLIAHHSLEGWLSWVNGSGYSAMKDPNRFPTAWHWTVARFNRYIDGREVRAGDLVQRYPVFAYLQHGHSANDKGPGGESEDGGVPGTTLRLLPEQEETWLRIHYDMRNFTGIDYKRVPGSKTGLVEHREMGGTQCPSNFYDGLWARIARGDDYDMGMTPEETARLERLERIVAGYGLRQYITGEDPKIIRGEEALVWADQHLNLSLPLTLDNLNVALRKIAAGNIVDDDDLRDEVISALRLAASQLEEEGRTE